MNSVNLIGRLTKDPELRCTSESQTAVATFTLAVDRAGAKEKTADFPRIICFGKTAENVERFCVKGRLVGIQGRIQTSSYKNKSGDTVYTTEVAADRVEFLEWKDKAEAGETHREERRGPAPEIPEGFQALEDDDDIPF